MRSIGNFSACWNRVAWSWQILGPFLLNKGIKKIAHYKIQYNLLINLPRSENSTKSFTISRWAIDTSEAPDMIFCPSMAHCNLRKTYKYMTDEYIHFFKRFHSMINPFFICNPKIPSFAWYGIFGLHMNKPKRVFAF